MKRYGCLVLWIGLVGAMAFAHPHVMIESRIEFDIDGQTCRGFWLDWEFDAYFGASVIHDYDSNRDGVFNGAETKAVYDGAFSNLANYGYFVILRKASAHGTVKKVSSFSAMIRNGVLAYRFYVPLVGSGFEIKPVVSIFDVTYFCSIICPEDGIKVNQTGGPGVRITRGQSKDPIYYNPYGAASDNRVYDRWEPGLQTAYPEEFGVESE